MSKPLLSANVTPDAGLASAEDMDLSGRSGPKKYRVRWLAVALTAMLVGSSCGGGSDTSPNAEQPENSDDSSDNDDPQTESSSELYAEVSTLTVPAGIGLSSRAHQTASFGRASYLVTERAEGMRLVAITAEGATDTDAFIAGGTAAQVFNSGTQVVMTGLDDTGALAVLSSPDGTTFTRAEIPVPPRYATADVWEATSVIGNALGVADLGGDLFVIAELGIHWPSDHSVAARHGYTISEEVGDAATSSGNITQAPQPDGDWLYTFKADGEVVFETLGRAAGVEPGYREALQAVDTANTLTYGSWVVSAGTATEQENRSFMDELAGDRELRALYPVKDGVAAIVADYSPDEPTDAPAAARRSTRARFVPAQTGIGPRAAFYLFLFAAISEDEAGRAGVPLESTRGKIPEKVAVSADVEGESYTLITHSGSEMSVYNSGTGTDWSQVPYTTGFASAPGAVIQVASNDVVAVWPLLGGGGTPGLFDLSGVDENSVAVDLAVALGEALGWNGPPPDDDVIAEGYKLWILRLNETGETGDAQRDKITIAPLVGAIP